MTMTIALNRRFPRTLIAAGLAVVGTFASFTATTGTAQAQTARSYTVTLANKLEAPKRVVLNGALWNCKDNTCVGTADGSAPANVCVRVVKEFGPVTQFATPKGELSADKLERCNAAA
jgi:curli biogenesis system outer membrane secretion channel CsgG